MLSISLFNFLYILSAPLRFSVVSFPVCSKVPIKKVRKSSWHHREWKVTMLMRTLNVWQELNRLLKISGQCCSDLCLFSIILVFLSFSEFVRSFFCNFLIFFQNTLPVQTHTFGQFLLSFYPDIVSDKFLHAQFEYKIIFYKSIAKTEE